MVGICDIKVGNAYQFTSSTLLYVTRKISDKEYRTISINPNKFIDYDGTLWFDDESYLRNDKCFIELDKEVFIECLNDTTVSMINKVIKFK